MKKFLMMIGLLVLPLSVSALQGDITLSCDKKTLSPGERAACNIKGVVSDVEISGFAGNISLGDGLTFVSFSLPEGSLFEGDADDGEIQLYTAGDTLTGNIDFGTFIVEAGDTSGVDVNVSITNAMIDVYVPEDENEVDTPISIDPFTIRIPSSDNSLSAIKIDDTLISGFDSNNTNYEVDFTNTSIDISAVGADGATVTGDIGTKQVSYGENNFVINVKAENGAEKQYTIKIVRPEIRELTSLKINDEDIELVSGTYRYTYKVENDITSVNIVATAGNGISFSDDFGSRTVSDLKVGNNEILVKTKDSDGDELVYTIVVDRFNAKGKDVAPKETETKEEKKPSGTVDNPKTGITGVSVALLGGCAVAYFVARKRGFIKKI